MLPYPTESFCSKGSDSIVGGMSLSHLASLLPWVLLVWDTLPDTRQVDGIKLVIDL